jgi:PBP1b-binding outer membrane lipoprotein LpoB
MKRILFILFALTLVAGCSSQPTVDTSTDEKMKSSIEQIRQSLPEEKKDDFDEALMVLAFSNISMEGLLAQGSLDAETTKAKMKESLHGKTGDEVIAIAEEVIRKRKEKERTQAIQEIKELEEQKAAAEEDKKELAKFEVLRSRFYKRKQDFLG